MKNAADILAMEFLAAAQGVDILRPLTSSESLEQVHAELHESVDPWIHDQQMSVDIEKACDVVHRMDIDRIGLR